MLNPRIIAISGPLRGWVFPITEEEFTFGQDETNQACLKDELVSRRHCSVRIENGCVVVRDLDSANGTVVSGEEIAAGGKKILTYMDRLTVGNSILVYYHDEDTFDISDDARPRKVIRLKAVNGAEPDYVRSDKVVLGALLRISSELNLIRNSDELQARLLELILEVMPAERAAILLTGHQEDTFVSRTYRDVEKADPTPFPLSPQIPYESLRDGVSILSSDVDSVVCVPLGVFEKRLGVIYLHSGAPDIFKISHLPLLDSIGGIAAVPLEHVRYVEWLEGENRRLTEEINVQHDNQSHPVHGRSGRGDDGDHNNPSKPAVPDRPDDDGPQVTLETWRQDPRVRQESGGHRGPTSADPSGVSLCG